MESNDDWDGYEYSFVSHAIQGKKHPLGALAESLTSVWELREGLGTLSWGVAATALSFSLKVECATDIPNEHPVSTFSKQRSLVARDGVCTQLQFRFF